MDSKTDIIDAFPLDVENRCIDFASQSGTKMIIVGSTTSTASLVGFPLIGTVVGYAGYAIYGKEVKFEVKRAVTKLWNYIK